MMFTVISFLVDMLVLQRRQLLIMSTEPTKCLDKLSHRIWGRALATKIFWCIFLGENASDSTNFLHFCVGKIVEIVAGAK